MVAAAQPELVNRRVVDRPDDRAVLVHQGQRRAPVRDAGQEVVGAVHRVDVPGATPGARRPLLTDQAVVGTLVVQPGHHELLGGMVGRGDHVRHRRLVMGRQTLFEHLARELARILHQLSRQAQIVHRADLIR
jgi:hypothetical protein